MPATRCHAQSMRLWTESHGAVSVSNADELSITLSEKIHSNSKEDGSSFFWLDIRDPSDLEDILNTLPIAVHPLTVEDMLLGEMREKCEFYDSYIFLSIHLLDMDEFYGNVAASGNSNNAQSIIHTHQSLYAKLSTTSLETTRSVLRNSNEASNVYLIVSNCCLVSVHWQGNSSCVDQQAGSMPSMAKVLASRIMRMEWSKTHSVSADWLTYIILDEIVDGLTAQCRLVQSEVDSIEELVFSLGRFDQSDMLRRIHQAHRRTTLLSRLIQPKIDLLKTIAKSDETSSSSSFPLSSMDHCSNLQETSEMEDDHFKSTKSAGSFNWFHTQTLIYLRDVQDHLYSMKQDLADNNAALGRAHDNFVGQADVELAIMGQEMEYNVHNLTRISMAAGVCLGISAIWGMNVKVPMELNVQSVSELIPFFGLIGLMLISMGVCYALFRFFRWL